MPNYRQKNRNRNKHKNRNKQQQQQQQKTAVSTPQKETEATEENQTEIPTHQQQTEQVVSIENTNVKLVEAHQNDSRLGNISNDDGEIQIQQQQQQPKAATTQTFNDNDKESSTDEIQNVPQLEYQQQEPGNELSDTESLKQEITQEMGTKNSKNFEENEATIKIRPQNEFYQELQPMGEPNNDMEKIVSKETEEYSETEADKAQKLNEAKVIIHRIIKETTPTSTQRLPSPERESNQNAPNSQNSLNTEVKVIFHRIELESTSPQSIASPVVLSPTPEANYLVTSPTNEIEKLRNISNFTIQELSDASLSDYNDNTPIVSEVESESETVSTSSKNATTISDDVDTKATQTSGNQQDDLRQRRVQKRAALENHFLPQLLSPRYLDCIIEENSDLSDARSDCSITAATTTQQTSSSAPQTPETPTGGQATFRRADARFPKSNLDFSRKHKHGQLPKSPTMPGAICEEPQAIIIETKEIAEPASCATGVLTSDTMMKPIEAAEVVFIDSASSSMSDLLEELTSCSGSEVDAADADIDENDEIEDDTTLSAMDLDTDTSDLLSYTARNSSAASEYTLTGGSSSREQTPVNQINEPPTPPVYRLKTEEQRSVDVETEQISTSNKLNDSDEQTSTKMSENIKNFEGNLKCSAILKTKTKTIKAQNSTQSFYDEYDVQATSTTNAINAADACLSFALPAAENTIIDSNTLLETLEVEMNNVRDVLSSLDQFNTNMNTNTDTETETVRATITKETPPIPPRKFQIEFENRHTKRVVNSQSPPPLPPPPTYLQDNHFSINNTINTITTQSPSSPQSPPPPSSSSSTLSSFLNDNNKAVENPSYTSPSSSLTPSTKLAMVRQESADSHCSDSTVNSQCTAINLCASPKVPDFDVMKSTQSYVSDAPSNTSAANADDQLLTQSSSIKKLRHLCTETLASMPYGEEVLVELANVAQNISEAHKKQTIIKQQQDFDETDNMPYPLPKLPVIEKLQVSDASGKVTITPLRPAPPPPTTTTTIPQQNDASWLGMPTEKEPKLLVCLSPAQRAYIEKQKEQNSSQKPDELLDAHQKYLDRRGYHEYTKEQVRAMNDEKWQEQQILETAAFMKTLRKSLSPPPPPVPPPPVPIKSSETAAKVAQKNPIQKSQKQIINTTVSGGVCMEQFEEGKAMNISKNDAIIQNANEQRQAKISIDAGFNVGEEHNSNNNKHRLLAIIHDDTTTETKANDSMNSSLNEQFAKAKTASTTTSTSSSSFENNSRQTRIQESTTTKFSSQSAPFQHSEPNTIQFPVRAEQPDTLVNIKMQSVESDLARMFPTMGEHNIFDATKKRYSNIETSSQTAPIYEQLLNTTPKRYSNIETHTYETGKRTENGQIIYDYKNEKHESSKDGDQQMKTHFPVKAVVQTKHVNFTNTAINDEKEKKEQPVPTTSSHVDEIMSALKLNTTKSETNEASKTATAPKTTAALITAPATAPPILTNLSNTFFTNVTTSSNTQHKTTTTTSENETNFINSGERKNENPPVAPPTPPQPMPSSYEEFRQRAKAAADAIYTNDKQQPQQQQQQQTTTFRSVDHEKLFKDFDELSNQLKAELDAGKAQRDAREKSASLFDLSRVQMQFNNDSFKELKERRHEHMQELEREIERSMRSRHSKQRSQEPERCREIPIKIENGYVPTGTGNTSGTNGTSGAGVVHNIPIQLEQQPPYEVTSPIPPLNYASDSYYENENRQFRRAESMFDLPTEKRATYTAQQQTQQQKQRPPQRERSYSNQYDGRKTSDDWSRYANDLGLSENITRPFAREVEICYQRQPWQPRSIRAPRLTVSTNDLSNNYLSPQTYDSFNAYGVRRTHAPMLSPVAPPQKANQQYYSCYSVLQRDPNPTYISTTSRRGVSPAPVSPQPPRNESPHFNVNANEMRQRRASLPREIQEQQLKYILSKEEELKTEFERLQNERKRLMDEMQRELNAESETETQQFITPTASPMPPITPPPRHAYRPIPPRRLPTLSEDEVFRQQMAEEWLNKVAEREERRLQKIIKISKAHEIEHGREIPIELTTAHSMAGVTPDIGSEFLKRVKERRTKLAMPADSDWESGAESQPQPQAGHASETEEIPKIKVYDGKAETDLSQLPKHLREFAKFSNHQTEKIDGGQRELHQEEERRQEANDNTFSSASKKTSVMKTVKVTRQHPYQQFQATTFAPTQTQTTTTSQQQQQPNNQGDHGSFGSACLNNQTTTSERVIPTFFETTKIQPPPPQPPTSSTTMNSPTVTTHQISSSNEAFDMPKFNKNFTPFTLDKLPTHASHATQQFSNFSTAFPTFGNHQFADSPFKNKIFEEFDQFWQRFHSSASATNDTSRHNI